MYTIAYICTKRVHATCTHNKQVMPKEKQLKVRVTDAEHATIAANAKEQGLTVSQYVLKQCVHNTERVHKEPAKRVHNEETCTQSAGNVYTQPKKEKPAPKVKAWSGGYGKDKAIK